MVAMIQKVCSKCGRPFTGSNCSNCTKKYNTRERENNGVYNSYWESARKYALSADNGLCKMCVAENKVITNARLVVHHIVPVEDDSELWYDYNNLITLCYQHHKIVHDHYDTGRKLETQMELRKLLKERM